MARLAIIGGKLARPADSRAHARGTGSRASTILTFGAFAYLIAIAIASAHPGPAGWGFHLIAFAPAPARVLVAALLLTGLALFMKGALGSRHVETKNRPRSGRRPAPSHVRKYVSWFLLIPYAAALWMLRARTYFLGDQWVWLDHFRSGRTPLFTEPLAATIWYWFVGGMRILRVPLDSTTVALLPVVCGIIGAVLAWGIAGQLRDGNRLPMFALILTLGTLQLFCGHIESYCVVYVLLLLYLYAGLRLVHGKTAPVLVGITLGAAISGHLLLLFLIPSYVWLIARLRLSLLVRAGILVLPLAVAAALLLALRFRPEDVTRPFGTLLLSMKVGGNPQSGLWTGISPRLPLELVNLLALVMPVPALLLIATLGTRFWSTAGSAATTRFLVMTAVPGFLTAIALLLAGTLAQDWDLLAIPIVPLAILGIAALRVIEPLARTRTAMAGLTLLSLGSSLGFVFVNASEEAGVRRFQTLVSEGAAIKAHERAFGNEKLVKYYSARREYGPMLVYAQRALAADPSVLRYWSNMGSALFALRRIQEARPYFEEAVRRGMKEGQLFYFLGECYMAEGRWADAVQQYRTAISLDGELPEYRHQLDLAMAAAGGAR